MSLLLVRYILTAAVRDRLFISFILFLCVAVSISFFLGSAAVNETQQFSIVFAASGLRIATILSLILFVVFYLRRSFDSRDVEYLLSRPISRLQFLISHFAAFFILSIFAAALVLVTIMAVSLGNIDVSQLIWASSILVECVVMTTMAMFFAMVLTSAVSAILITMGFYVLARLIGQIHGIIENRDMGEVFSFLEKVMSGVSIFVPRLDLLGQSSWLIYGFENTINLSAIIIQCFIFCGLILVATYIDLSRRQF